MSYPASFEYVRIDNFFKVEKSFSKPIRTQWLTICLKVSISSAMYGVGRKDCLTDLKAENTNFVAWLVIHASAINHGEHSKGRRMGWLVIRAPNRSAFQLYADASTSMLQRPCRIFRKSIACALQRSCFRLPARPCCIEQASLILWPSENLIIWGYILTFVLQLCESRQQVLCFHFLCMSRHVTSNYVVHVRLKIPWSN